MARCHNALPLIRQHRLIDQHERPVTLAEQVIANETDRVLIFPETILGQWQALSSWLWADAASAYARSDSACSVPGMAEDGSHYENIAGVMDRHGDFGVRSTGS